jgi:hypothetical protein
MVHGFEQGHVVRNFAGRAPHGPLWLVNVSTFEDVPKSFAAFWRGPIEKAGSRVSEAGFLRLPGGYGFRPLAQRS